MTLGFKIWSAADPTTHKCWIPHDLSPFFLVECRESFGKKDIMDLEVFVALRKDFSSLKYLNITGMIRISKVMAGHNRDCDWVS
jgi:hypothetical protein